MIAVRPTWSLFVMVLVVLFNFSCGNIKSSSSDFQVQQHSGKQIVSVTLSDYHRQMQWLAQQFDVAGVDYENKTVDLVVTDDELSLLTVAFGRLQILETLSSELAPDAGYFNYTEMTDAIKLLEHDFPDLIKIELAGKSLESRDIWVVKISDNVALREKEEPTVLFNAMHHAREIMTTEVAMDLIEHLLKNYGHDDKVTQWVNNNEIWVIPMVNPDGNNKVWTSDNMWRKNVRGGYGVDNNRNYPYKWGACNGSSGYTFAQNYRGTSAASEPETNAVMNVVKNIRPVFDISYHSYSEMVLYPYGCNGEHTESYQVVEKIGKELANQLPRDSSSGFYQPGTPWEILYSVDGGDVDWMYNEYNVIPFVIEMNQSFQPSYDQWRNKTVTKMRASWGFLLDKLEKSGVRGIVSSANELDPSKVEVTVKYSDSDNIVAGRYPVNPDGTFHFVLNPGKYDVTFKLDNLSQSHVIDVGENRVNLNVILN